jgi:opacity protein-like surface antigen
LDWPVDQISNEHAEAPLDHKFSQTMINVGLNYYLLREGQTRPYLGGGISYIHGKVEMLEDFSFSDVSQLEIGNPKLAGESVSTVGFFGKAGVDITVSESIAVFGEGCYALALKKDVPHPFGTEVAGKDDPVEINMGGISVLFGIKVRL